MNDQQLNVLRWGSTILAISIPFIAWGGALNWQIFGLSLYQYFPLLGLWGFFIMSTHFLIGAIRAKNSGLKPNTAHKTFTEYAVLLCIVLHPALLALVLWQDSYGLPPASYYEFIGSAGKFAIFAGSLALFIFLSFEVFNRLKQSKKIQQYWAWIITSQVVAMGLIFYHGLQIGVYINGWFLYVWWLVGIIVAICAAIVLQAEVGHAKHTNKPKT